MVSPEPPGPPAQAPKPATHDTSRVSFHVKHLGRFAETLEEVRVPPSSSSREP